MGAVGRCQLSMMANTQDDAFDRNSTEGRRLGMIRVSQRSALAAITELPGFDEEEFPQSGVPLAFMLLIHLAQGSN